MQRCLPIGRAIRGGSATTRSVPEHFSPEDAVAFVADMRARDRTVSPNWAILHRGQVVGVVSMTFEQDHRFGTVGYGVHGDLRGQGVTRQAVATVIGEALDQYPTLRKVRAHTDAANHPSMRVLEKMGFVREATLRRNQFAKGKFVDEVIYGLLRENWRQD